MANGKNVHVVGKLNQLITFSFQRIVPVKMDGIVFVKNVEIRRIKRKGD